MYCNCNTFQILFKKVIIQKNCQKFPKSLKSVMECLISFLIRSVISGQACYATQFTNSRAFQVQHFQTSKTSLLKPSNVYNMTLQSAIKDVFNVKKPKKFEALFAKLSKNWYIFFGLEVEIRSINNRTELLYSSVISSSSWSKRSLIKKTKITTKSKMKWGVNSTLSCLPASYD